MKKRVAETSKFKKKIESEVNRTATVNYFFKDILTKKKISISNNSRMFR